MKKKWLAGALCLGLSAAMLLGSCSLILNGGIGNSSSGNNSSSQNSASQNDNSSNNGNSSSGQNSASQDSSNGNSSSQNSASQDSSSNGNSSSQNSASQDSSSNGNSSGTEDTPVTPTEYTVTLDFGNGRKETKKLEGGSLLGELPTEDTGASEIIGWSTVPTQLVEYEGRVSADLTLYAIWQNYKVVTLVYGEEDAREEKVYEGTDGKAVFPSESRENYILDGWSAEEGGEIVSVTFADLGDTYYANWTSAYAVSSVEGLKAIANDPSAYYYLTGNINMKAEEWTPIETFDGVLEGNGYKIFNFMLTTTAPGENFGFFNVNNGTIQNLSFDDYTFNVTGTIKVWRTMIGVVSGINTGLIKNVHLSNGVSNINISINYSGEGALLYGGITGQNEYSGRVENCNSETEIQVTSCSTKSGKIEATWIGGLVGENYGGKVTNCVNKDNIDCTMGSSAGTLKYCIGGLIGLNSYYNNYLGECADSYSDVKIEGKIGTVNGSIISSVGNLVGGNAANISNCYSTGTLSGGSKDSGELGGLCGTNVKNISNCYTTVDLNLTQGWTSFGGFVGGNYGVIKECYAAGSVTSITQGNAGGFAGYNDSKGTISKCWTSDSVTLQSIENRGLFVGSNYGLLNQIYYASEAVLTVGEEVVEDTSGLGEAKELAVLQSKDFLIDTLYWEEEYWTVTEGYPKLVWETE